MVSCNQDVALFTVPIDRALVSGTSSAICQHRNGLAATVHMPLTCRQHLLEPR